jgi:preprotein translocase subunit SecG
MTFVLFIVIAVCVILFVVLLAGRRRSNSDDAVASFREHLDALSSESRQHVIDRVRSQVSDTETEHGA